MHAYAEKAMREASDGTTWTAPDTAYEAAVHEAVDAAYDDPRLRGAWDQLDALITPHGWSNSLGQKLVQLTMPGVPDVYQGTELWDDSLVDPDNRRPVDFAERIRLLESLGDAPPGIDETGAAKLWITRQASGCVAAGPTGSPAYRAVDGQRSGAAPPDRLRPRRGHHTGHSTARRTRCHGRLA